MGRTRRIPRPAVQLEERLLACNRLAIALIETKQTSSLQIEVAETYAYIKLDLRDGRSWTGEYLHKMQEFMYEHGAKFSINNDQRIGPHLMIWPYNEKEDDGQHS